MKKIAVTHNLNLSDAQKKRLGRLGEVTYYESFPKTNKIWLKRTQGANIICSRKTGLEDSYIKLKNVVISVPFVDVSWGDLKIIKKNEITLLNSPGCNKHAVSEWIIGMIINMLRDLPNSIHSTETLHEKSTLGLKDKRIVILGKGNIGKQVGKISKAFEMKISFFKKGDDLVKKVSKADIIVNCLSTNKKTVGLLDKKFFNSLKKESYFVSVTTRDIYNPLSLIEALDNGILNGVALDAASTRYRHDEDVLYKKLSRHPKIMTTSYTAGRTDVSSKISNDMMIENLEKFLKK